MYYPRRARGRGRRGGTAGGDLGAGRAGPGPRSRESAPAGRRLMTGPSRVSARAGVPGGQEAERRSTTFRRGRRTAEPWTSRRVLSAQAWPACKQTCAAFGITASRSASSRTTIADLPPSSRNIALEGLGALARDQPADRGGAGERHLSTRGSVTRSSATALSRCRDDVDHTRGDVGVLGDQPADRVDVHGVFGSGLSTTVLPVASAWPSLLATISNG